VKKTNLLLKDFICEAPATAVKGYLNESWGDWELMQTNLIFRHLRFMALDMGYQFEVSPRPSTYFAWPMMGLDQIYETKKVPYHNNFEAVKRIEQLWPGKFHLDEIMRVPPQQNFVMHESVHLVAKEVWQRFQDKNRMSLVPFLVWSEACANACELLSYCDAWSVHEKFFLMRNTYLQPKDTQTSRALHMIKFQLGIREALQVLILMYMLVNLQFPRMTGSLKKGLFTRWIPKKSKHDPFDKIFMQLAQFAWTLSPEFRLHTSALYAKAQGLKRPLPIELKSLREEGVDFVNSALNVTSLFANFVVEGKSIIR
jgi:hypothetical protein